MNDPVTLSSLVAATAAPAPVRPAIMVVAFEGWNDAGDAASSALKTIKAATGAVKVAGIGDDDYYDYQFSRPQVRRNAAGKRVIKWPTTRIYRASLPDAPVDLLLVRGVEPTYRWKAFIAEILTRAEEENVHGVMALGALLADVPHTRPIQASDFQRRPDGARGPGRRARAPMRDPPGSWACWPSSPRRQGCPRSRSGRRCRTMWPSRPPPRPQLALLHRVEELLPLALDLHELGEDALAWERGVNALATGDADIAAYVQQLEQAQDETELPEATGEAIAREFERYLKRRHRPGAAGAQEEHDGHDDAAGDPGGLPSPQSPETPDTPGVAPPGSPTQMRQAPATPQGVRVPDAFCGAVPWRQRGC